MNEILRCQGVTKAFDSLLAVSGIDLNVGEDEVLGVIGANGAGKTTLVNIISGYVVPSSGRVMLCGEDIIGMPPREVFRKGVARSFQIPQLFDSFSGLENVMLGLSLRSNGRLGRLLPFAGAGRAAEARQILERFGIVDYEASQAGTLPQGVRKLLDIALALCGSSPRIILLDEPTSGVSADEKHAIMDTLWSAFKQTRIAVLFIEHDMDLVQRYAGRVVALYEGRVIANGVPSEVFKDDLVRQFVTGVCVPATAG